MTEYYKLALKSDWSAKNESIMNLNTEAIVFANGLVCIECDPGNITEFWVELGKEIGWGKFTEVKTLYKKKTRPFRLTEVRPAHNPVPSPIASSLGVLWRRKAAISAQRAFGAYYSGLHPKPKSSPQLVPLWSRHES